MYQGATSFDALCWYGGRAGIAAGFSCNGALDPIVLPIAKEKPVRSMTTAGITCIGNLSKRSTMCSIGRSVGTSLDYRSEDSAERLVLSTQPNRVSQNMTVRRAEEIHASRICSGRQRGDDAIGSDFGGIGVWVLACAPVVDDKFVAADCRAAQQPEHKSFEKGRARVAAEETQAYRAQAVQPAGSLSRGVLQDVDRLLRPAPNLVGNAVTVVWRPLIPSPERRWPSAHISRGREGFRPGLFRKGFHEQMWLWAARRR